MPDVRLVPVETNDDVATLLGLNAAGKLRRYSVDELSVRTGGGTTRRPLRARFSEVCDVRDFGATGLGTDPVADMAAIKAALVAARARKCPVVLSGTLALRPPVDADFLLYGRADNPVRICIPLQSGDRLIGAHDCEIVVHAPVGYSPTGAHRIILFGAASTNTAQGVYSNITIENVTVNFRTTDWSSMAAYYVYAFGFIGADHVVRRNCRFYSPGTRAGRGILAFNCRNRVDENIRHENIIQGYYTKYDHYVTGRNLYFKGLVECIDIDGYGEGCRWSELTFIDLVNEGQCIDASPVADCIFENIYAKNCGAVFFSYTKEPYGYVFADYWALVGTGGETAETQVQARDIVVRNVFAENCGRPGEETFRISNDRQVGKTAPCIQNVTLENWVIEGGYGGIVYECDGLSIRNMVMRNVSGYVAGAMPLSYALLLRQAFGSGIGSDVANASILRGTVENLSIEGCSAGGLMAVFPQDITFKNIKIANYNTGGYNAGAQANPNYGFSVLNCGVKPNNVVTFDGNITISGGPAGATDLVLGYLAGAAGKTRINKRNAVFSLASGAIPLKTTLSTIVRYTDPIVVHVPTINTVAAATVYVPLTPVLGNDEVFQVQTVYLTSYEGITGDATNNTTMTLQRATAGTLLDLTGSAMVIDAASLAAGSVREITAIIDTTAAAATIRPGDALGLKFTRNGAGSIRSGLIVEVHGLRYRTLKSADPS